MASRAELERRAKKAIQRRKRREEFVKKAVEKDIEKISNTLEKQRAKESAAREKKVKKLPSRSKNVGESIKESEGAKNFLAASGAKAFDNQIRTEKLLEKGSKARAKFKARKRQKARKAFPATEAEIKEFRKEQMKKRKRK